LLAPAILPAVVEKAFDSFAQVEGRIYCRV